MNVSLLCALFNRWDLTAEMLRSLRAYTELVGAEVILIDNASSDETAENIARLGPPFRVVRNASNVGFARANNQAAAMARSDRLIFVNSDLVFGPGWLDPMMAGLEADGVEPVGAVGNVQLDARTGLVDHAGVFFGRDGMPTHARKGRALPPAARYFEWNAVTAACLAMRRETFEAVGGFDTGYVNGMEDIDLSVRLRLAGHRLLVANRSVVRHHVSSSPGRRDHDDANSARFAERWAHVTTRWGEREWPFEYLHRYARQPWKLRPGWALTAAGQAVVRTLAGQAPARAVQVNPGRAAGR